MAADAGTCLPLGSPWGSAGRVAAGSANRRRGGRSLGAPTYTHPSRPGARRAERYGEHLDGRSHGIPYPITRGWT
jgi:hypothetical protein